MALALGPLLGEHFAGWVFDSGVPAVHGYHRPRLSAVRREGAGGAADGVEWLPLRLVAESRGAGRYYQVLKLGGRRVKYARLVLLATAGEPTSADCVAHHEQYRRELYKGAKVWVGDDLGPLEWMTRAEHAPRHKLGLYKRV